MTESLKPVGNNGHQNPGVNKMTNTLFTARIKRAPKGDSFKIAVSVNGMNADFRSVDGYTMEDAPRAIAEMASRLGLTGELHCAGNGAETIGIMVPAADTVAESEEFNIAIEPTPFDETSTKAPAKRSKPEAIAAE
jgi:hypothetical protein